MKAPSEEEQPGPVTCNTRLECIQRPMTDHRSTLTSVGPENNIIFIRIVPTLKEVEKQMSSFDINIPSERSVGNMF